MENEEENMIRMAEHISLLGSVKNRICSVYISKEEVNHLLSFKESKDLINKVTPNLLIPHYDFVYYIYQRAKIESSYEKNLLSDIADFKIYMNLFERKIIEGVSEFKKKIIEDFNQKIISHITSNCFINEYNKGTFSNDNEFKNAINKYIINLCSNSYFDLSQYENFIRKISVYKDSITELDSLSNYILNVFNTNEKINLNTKSKIDSIIKNIEKFLEKSKEKWNFYKVTTSKFLENLPSSYIPSLEIVEKILQSNNENFISQQLDFSQDISIIERINPDDTDSGLKIQFKNEEIHSLNVTPHPDMHCFIEYDLQIF
jgi:hypothetical protein